MILKMKNGKEVLLTRISDGVWHAEDPQAIFQHGIDIGELSTQRGRYNYVGEFMYMHTELDGDGTLFHAFKHRDTRKYFYFRP